MNATPEGVVFYCAIYIYIYILINLNKDIFSPTALKQNYSNASEPVFLSRLIIPTPL